MLLDCQRPEMLQEGGAGQPIEVGLFGGDGEPVVEVAQRGRDLDEDSGQHVGGERSGERSRSDQEQPEGGKQAARPSPQNAPNPIVPVAANSERSNAVIR